MAPQGTAPGGTVCDSSHGCQTATAARTIDPAQADGGWWYVRGQMTGYRAVTTTLAATALALAGCGSEERQDVNEAAATYTVDVSKASFPASQRLARQAEMEIKVKNTGDRAIPDIAVTVDSFSRRSKQEGLADPERPVWIVDSGPRGGNTAFVNTWALEDLRPGQTKTFSWKVTPIEPGRYSLKYTVAAGLDGKAKARLDGGDRPEGTFTVKVRKEPSQSRVDPETGEVIRD